ncbi:putative transcriptional regulator [Halarchaeum solikamskense]|uniref:hypothetical protein n=1 Tax=Halarchaeum nitratireducens TaxID=489913 RepID=UPI001B3AF7B3|nr:hypothetical protein [Halarchaeum solikamskense]MBP2250243.1 putative transcriptional regulator [Halarchaeum solikamskense]
MHWRRVVGLGATGVVLFALVGSSLLGTVAVLAVLVDSGIGFCRAVGPVIERVVFNTCSTAGRRPIVTGIVVASIGAVFAARFRR